MKRFLSVLLVGLLFFCTACTPTQAGSNGGAAPTAQTDKELTACTAVTDKGLYSVEVYRHDIANIMYLDFATGRSVNMTMKAVTLTFQMGKVIAPPTY